MKKIIISNIFLSQRVDLFNTFKRLDGSKNTTEITGLLKLLSILLFIGFSVPSNAQWTEKNNGLYGGQVSAVAVSEDASTIYAGLLNNNNHGIYKSTDNGANWSITTNGVASPYPYYITTSGSYVFSTNSFGIIRSGNNGISWQELAGPPVDDVYFMESIGNRIFASGYNNSLGTYVLYVSSDNGDTWTEINNGLPDQGILSIAEHNGFLFVGTYDRVYRSADNGASWTIIPTGMPEFTWVISLVSNGTDLYAGADDAGIFKSVDNGLNWTTALDGFAINPRRRMNSLKVIGSSILAATNYGILLSSDNGVTWNSSDAGLYNTDVSTMDIAGTNIIIGTNGGIYISSDSGLNWSIMNTGITHAYVKFMSRSGTDIYAGTRSGVFKSSDEAESWTYASAGITNYNANAFLEVGTNILVGTPDGVFLSSNNAASWSLTELSGINISSLALNGTDVFAGSEVGVFRSTNNGVNWSGTSGAGLPINAQYFDLRVLAFNGNSLFAATSEGVYRSTDNASNWTAINGLPTSTEITVLLVKDSKIFVSIPGSGLYVSNDDGNNWALTGFNGSTYALYSNGTDLFAGGGYVSLSTDDGVTWTQTDKWQIANARSFLTTDTHLLSGTDDKGVSSLSLSEFYPPTLSSFTPTSGAEGDTIYISGTYLSEASAVYFGNIPAASFIVESDNTIAAIVGSGASGDVVVDTPSGQLILGGFSYVIPPTISSFAPASAGIGETIIINGSKFTGTTEVYFGITPASSFSVLDDLTISAVVGAGSSGDISVIAPDGTASKSGFSYTSANSFITTWQTTTANESITIPIFSGELYNYEVEWGDGTVESAFTGDATHTYANAGTYIVSITGVFPMIYFHSGAEGQNIDKILTIEQWGDNSWTSMEEAFRGCTNLSCNAVDSPDLSGVISLFGMFASATVFNGDLSNWDVSTIQNFQDMFLFTEFNSDISAWNTGAATNMQGMFAHNLSFNQPIGNWNVSNVQNMLAMFQSTLFNQDISSWNVGNVQNMSLLFVSASAFNGNISNWDISSVTDMTNMLDNSGMSTANYDATLSGWATLDTGEAQIPSGLTLGSVGINYCSGENARNTLINTYGWTINGDVKNCISSDAEILAFDAFSFNFLDTATVVIGVDSVSLTMASTTDVTSITPYISISTNASISPASQVVQDFTNPIVYTVTAEDGTTQKSWVVTVAKDTSVLELVAQYTFDGGAANDITSNGYDGIPVNNPLFSVDRFGQSSSALEPEGNGTYVSINHGGNWDMQGAVVFNAWIRPNTLPLASEFGAVIFREEAFGELDINDQGSFFYHRPNVLATTDVGAIKVNQWSMVTLVIDSNSNLQLYVNGVPQYLTLLDTSIEGVSIPIPRYTGIGTNASFGDNSTNNRWFSGSIDDARVYLGGILTPTEIKDIYQAELSGGLNQKVASYSFDFGSLLDVSGNNYHGNFRNVDGNFISTITTTDRFGNANGALQFDNNGNYSDVYHERSINLRNNLTVNLWVNPASIASAGELGDVLISDSNGGRLMIFNDASLAYHYPATATDPDNYPSVTSAPNVVNTNDWQMVTYSIDNENTLNLYHNGILVATGDVSDHDYYLPDRFIIAEPDGAGTSDIRFYHGALDDVDIYQRTLTAEEISFFYVNETLAAYYPFDGNALDQSGNGYDGTVSGAVLTSDRYGNANSAYNFNTGNVISALAPPNLYDQFSIAAWVRLDSSSPGGPIVEVNSSSIQAFQFEVNESNQLYLVKTDDTGAEGYATGTQILSTDTWHHVVLVNTGTAVSFFIDGVLDNETNDTGTIRPDGINMYLGGSAGGSESFDGDIDEVRIYSKALTATDVSGIYNAEKVLSIENEITDFSLAGVAGGIWAGRINISVSNGTDVTALVAVFTASAGATVTVNGTEQFSGSTTLNFTNPITYVVTAEDGVTIQNWTVTVTTLPPAPIINSFSPASALIGSDIIISGDNFSTTEAVVLTTDLLTGGSEKSWKLRPAAGSIGVGPEKDSFIWWPQSADSDLSIDRACIFNDEYIFKTGSEFEYKTNGDIYGEPYMGLAEGCQSDANIVGTDAEAWGSGIHSFSLTPATTTEPAFLTVTGTGAFIGLSKAFNGGEYEIGPPISNASVTYEVLEYLNDGVNETLKLSIDIGTGFWTFVLSREGANVDIPSPNLVSFNGTPAPIVGSPTSSSITATVPEGATDGKITVQIGDEIATSSNDFIVESEDEEIVLEFTGLPNEVDAIGGSTLSVDVTDNTIINTVTLLYRGISRGPSASFQSKATTNNGNIYSANLEGNEDPLGIEFKFSAELNSGGTAETEISFININHSGDGLTIPSDRIKFSETDASQYRAISIPLNMNNGNSNTVFDELGAYKENWRLYSYTSSSSSFSEHSSGTSMTLGKGYFILANASASVKTGAGSTPNVTPTSPVEIQINQGWNLIGNPYNFSIDWNDVLSANTDVTNIGELGTALRIWKSGYSESNVLLSFQGGFVFSAQAMSIKIPVTRNGSLPTNGGRTIEKEDSDLPNWVTTINLKEKGSIINKSKIGMHENANLSYDKYDLVRLPSLVNSASLKIEHPEFFAPAFSSDFVPVANYFDWKLQMDNFNEGGRYTLDWKLEATNKSNKVQILYDLSNQKRIDMSEVTNYTFTAKKGQVFKVFYGDIDEINNSLLPYSITLGDVYPNPVIDNMVIPFNIPEVNDGNNVEVSLYNLQGKKIITLINDKQRSGFHQITWDRMTEQGAKTPAGLYIITLKVGSTVQSKKMIFN